MATFNEIKLLIYKVLNVESQFKIDDSIAFDNGRTIALKNDALLDIYNKMSSYHSNNLELYNDKYRECAVEFFSDYIVRDKPSETTNDPTNKINYTLGAFSNEYCVYILGLLADRMQTDEKEIVSSLRFRIRFLPDNITKIEDEVDNPLEMLPMLLPMSSIRIKTDNTMSYERLSQLCAAFEFVFMYRTNISFYEMNDLTNLFISPYDSLPFQNGLKNNTPPLRIYNDKVLSYYAMAIKSADPFTRYISYYHVVEYYFDAAFKKNLTEQIKAKITSPDFSYKDNEKIYDLAKYIRKHMSEDIEEGKGNEFESLKYVLNEYVVIDELKNRIKSLSSDSVDYYQNNSVPFVTKKTTQISWADPKGVFTTLANRIYLTRNALVHSKSEMEDNLYKPYEHKQDLIKEIPLIRAVAEQVIINSSEDI